MFDIKRLFHCAIIRKMTGRAVMYALKKRGHIGYGIFELQDRILKDLLDNPRETLGEKLRAYRKGFLSYTAKDYGVTDENHRSFISDFDYYSLYPVNARFSHWIDDKITLKYILAPFRDYLPAYYCHLRKPGEIVALMDWEQGLEPTCEAILELLKQKGGLAVKQVAGEKGAGFYRIACVDGRFLINGAEYDERGILAFLAALGDYLVTEYITPHPDVARIYGQSTNTLRAMVINEDGRSPYVANALMRFGRNATGCIENITANGGGLFAIVDLDTGHYHDGKRIEGYHAVEAEYHPDTGIRVEGVLPHWEKIQEKVLEIAGYIPELRYMGFDIVITAEGFKVLEINSMQGINFFQYYYPLLEGHPSSAFFRNLIEEAKK